MVVELSRTRSIALLISAGICKSFQIANFVFLNEPFSASFSLFSSFQQLIVNMLIIKLANDWIGTTDLWYRKRPLCQLSHNHCPT